MSKTNIFSIMPVLTIIFIVLKLTGYITWSWWWVTLPLWIPTACFLGFLAVLTVIGLVILFVDIESMEVEGLKYINKLKKM